MLSTYGEERKHSNIFYELFNLQYLLFSYSILQPEDRTFPQGGDWAVSWLVSFCPWLTATCPERPTLLYWNCTYPSPDSKNALFDWIFSQNRSSSAPPTHPPCPIPAPGTDKPKLKSELELELFSSNYSNRAGAGAFRLQFSLPELKLEL